MQHAECTIVLIWCTLPGGGADVSFQMVLQIQLTWFRADNFDIQTKTVLEFRMPKELQIQQAPSKVSKF